MFKFKYLYNANFVRMSLFARSKIDVIEGYDCIQRTMQWSAMHSRGIYRAA